MYGEIKSTSGVYTGSIILCTTCLEYIPKSITISSTIFALNLIEMQLYIHIKHNYIINMLLFDNAGFNEYKNSKCVS